MQRRFTVAEARRMAIAAQGLGAPRPRTEITLDHIRGVIHQLGLLQLDFVNLLLPAHYMVLYSRLGSYRREHLDDLVYRHREFTEHWAHEASIIPMSSWPLLRDRREAHRVRPYDFDTSQYADYFVAALDQIRSRGAQTAAQIDMTGVSNRRAHEWYGTVSRIILEAHLGQGLLAVANRLPNFARSYDLAERIVPAEFHQSRVDVHEAHRRLAMQAVAGYGIATLADISDYFRMPALVMRPRVAELVASGQLEQVVVEDWRAPVFALPGADIPHETRACALLAPFDPLVWFRPRVSRLFDFEYRFEIFVPPDQRRWGAYVLPFLLGDRLVARVDVKVNRESGVLLVPSAYVEPGCDAAVTAAALASELRTLVGWLRLEKITVGRKGNLSGHLRKAVIR